MTTAASGNEATGRHDEPCQSVFDGDARYAAIFESVHQSLTGRVPRHTLLLRDRGVGEQAVLTEVAQQAARGHRAGLTRAEFIRIDTRYTLPGSEREVLDELRSA